MFRIKKKTHTSLNVALGRTQPQQCDILATFNEPLKYFMHSAQNMG